MKKKLLAAVLSLSMVLGMGFTTLAADTTEISAADENGVYGKEIIVDSTVKVPLISITVPSALGAIGLNPYKMEYEIEGTTYKDQVASVENTITNGSEVAVAVNVASLVADVPQGSGVVFATAALKGTETTKSAFLYLEMIKSGGTYATGYTKADNQLLVGAKAASKTNMIVLDADGGTAPEATFKFIGTLATNPAKAWAEADKFTVKVKFTFTPQMVAGSSSTPTT